MTEEGSQQEAKFLINEGKSLLAARRFADAWEVLDHALRLDKRNPEINTLLGIASLYQEFLSDAGEYFRKAIELDRDNADARCGLSYVLMRQDQVAEATEELCDVLRIFPRHTIARRRFKELKTVHSIDAWVAGLHPSMFVAIPKASRKWKTPAWFPVARGRKSAIVIILLCLSILTFTCVKNKWFFLRRTGGDGGSMQMDKNYPAAIPLNTDIGLRMSRALKASRSPAEIFLSDAEISALLTRAQALLKTGEDNEARFVINKVLASNADRISLDVAKKLEGFVKAPNLEKMRYNPDLTDVIEYGPLFRGVHVKWLTRVVRRTNQIFLQVAPARFHGSTDSRVKVVVVDRSLEQQKAGSTVEVFGEVLGVDVLSPEDSVIFIEGKSMRNLERRR
jgi:tetratricopeptide (TPR) repeat protein